MPVKLRSQRKRTEIVSAYCDLGNDNSSLNDIDLETEIRGYYFKLIFSNDFSFNVFYRFKEILKRRGVKQRSSLSKNVESQTDINLSKVSQLDNSSLNEIIDKRNQSTPKVSHKLENKEPIAEEKPSEEVETSKETGIDKAQICLNKIEQNILIIEYQEEIQRLKIDLKSAQDLILKFQREETALKEK
jgi:hypothetical protein